ncbi:MAG: DUF4352 domain-containing protein [Chloroflexi bacterium]|nr:DUF4352 domain-containing protein [Chloroflexota bacterium]
MPQFLRFGCAGIAVIIIAALTSVGLYAVLTGGSPFAASAPKPIAGGAQVLVTIQAGQPTPTPLSAATPTATQAATAIVTAPASILTAPVAAAAAAPASGPTPAPSVAPATPVASPPPAGASPAPGGPSRADPSRLSVHEGLSAEVIEVERSWQATDATGAPIRLRDGFELVTVHVRFTNTSAEARYVAEGDLVLVADDGARFAPRSSLPVREPRLLTVPLLAGDTTRGWVTYETPQGQPTRRLQWSPTRPDRPRAEATFNLSLPR